MTRNWTAPTAATLRRRGNTERDRRNWPAAAYYFGKYLTQNPGDAPLWLQHGHMLKEAGLLAAAADSYSAALALEPGNAEFHLQIGLLCKVRGQFDDAARHCAEAARLGYEPQSFVATELAALRRTHASKTARPEIGHAVIYLSSVSPLQSETDVAGLKQVIGAAHYSYGYILRGYKSALEQAGYQCQVIRNPEYMANVHQEGSTGPRPLHIGFYPPDGARYLKGARNVICMAWEFARLKSVVEMTSYHAFADPIAMLAGANETWVISSFGAEATRRSGVQRVRSVPTPVPTNCPLGRREPVQLEALQEMSLKLDRVSWVPLAIWPSIQQQVSHQAKARSGTIFNSFLDIDPDLMPLIFVSVFNVHDYRKQIKPLVEAFVRFAADVPHAYLLLKVSCIDSDKLDINTMMLMDQIAEPGEMTAPLMCDRVFMTTDVLSRDEMNVLYDISAFYVCTSHAEGQNLPLIEAMGRGVVPVSVDHTAMSDYIRTDNAIVIPSKAAPMTPRLTQRYGLYSIDTYYVAPLDVWRALDQAAKLDLDAYAALSAKSVDTVADVFGLDRFIAAVEDSLAAARVLEVEKTTGSTGIAP